MKIRTGFVANSSSSSFTIVKNSWYRRLYFKIYFFLKLNRVSHFLRGNRRIKCDQCGCVWYQPRKWGYSTTCESCEAETVARWMDYNDY